MGHSRVVALALPVAFDAALDLLECGLLSRDVFNRPCCMSAIVGDFSVRWSHEPETKMFLPLLFHLAWCGLYEVSTAISVKHELAIIFNVSLWAMLRLRVFYRLPADTWYTRQQDCGIFFMRVLQTLLRAVGFPFLMEAAMHWFSCKMKDSHLHNNELGGIVHGASAIKTVNLSRL